LVNITEVLVSDNLAEHFKVKVFSGQPSAGMTLNFSPDVDQIVAGQGEHMEEGWPGLARFTAKLQNLWSKMD